jgi:predicted dehydrogenase
MNDRKVRWGILGTARIGTEKVIPAVQRGELCEVIAIASRSADSAAAAAARLGIAKSYGSYEELLADADVDAVYNPLPNHLHVPWSIRALEAGKHVLCEKPIALSSAEALELVAAGRRHPHLKLMEAFMYRHHPQWIRAREIVTTGGIGDLRTVSTLFSYFNADPGNIRNQAGIGGGALMDIGCYPISLSRFLFDAEPHRVLALVETDPALGTDRLESAILDFGRGTSTFTTSTQLVPYQRVQILGTTGRVEIEIPFNAPPDRPCRMWHETGGGFVSGSAGSGDAGGIEELVLDVCDQYTIQGDLFARAILDDGPVPTPIEDAVANMRVIESLVESGRRGTWADVPG